MPTVNGNILRSLIEFCYTGRVAINTDVAVELLKTAHMLLLHYVVTACSNFLGEQLHPSNCLEIAIFAELHQCEILLQKAKNYSFEHILDVCKVDEFFNLNAEQLGHLLASDGLCVSAEEDVFRILMKWIEHDRSEREKYKDTLLKSVRFPLLERTFLIKQVKPICTSTASHQLYVDALECHLLPDHTMVNARKFIPAKQFLMCITEKFFYKLNINYYCPQRLHWIKCSKTLEYRSRFGLAVMNENLFILGGVPTPIDGNVNTVICLNLKTMSTTAVAPMIKSRSYCGAAVLKGMLYAIGGTTDAFELNAYGISTSVLRSVEKWNPTTNTWSEVASMTVYRYSCGIVEFKDKLYAVGGTTVGGTYLNSAEYYDPQQNVWKSIAPMSASYNCPGVAVANGLLYAVGKGNMVERYDPRINKWTLVGGMNLPNCRIFCTTLKNKVVMHYNGSFEEYNEGTNEWKEAFNKLNNVCGMFVYSDKLLGS